MLLSATSTPSGQREMKQGQERPLSPMELPELLQIIDRDLSYRDRVACMLVCRAWRRQFEDLAWRNTMYNRANAQELEKKGYLINSLRAYFPLDDHHLSTIAKHCPNIVSLDIEIASNARPDEVDSFMASMSNVSDLRLLLKGASAPGFLCTLTRMSGLRTLHLAGGASLQFSKDPFWFIALLQVLPTLQSISVDIQVQEPPARNRITQPRPIRGVEYNVAARPLGLIGWLKSFTKESNIPPEVLQYRKELLKAQRKEPWRKFVPLELPPVKDESSNNESTLPPPACYNLLDKSMIPNQPMHHITRLVVSHLTIRLIPVIANSLFPLLPRLQEVAMNFAEIRSVESLGLTCMSEHCRALKSIRIQLLLIPRFQAPSVIPMELDVLGFCRNMPPGIRSLQFRECSIGSDCLAAIPTESLRELKTLELRNTGSSQKVVDEFLGRCPQLTSLTLASLLRPSSPSEFEQAQKNCTTLAVLSRGDYFLGDETRPTWECTWTLKQVYVDSWYMVELNAFKTLFDRIDAMPCLTWLSISFCQARQLIADLMKHQPHHNGINNTHERPSGSQSVESATDVEPSAHVRWNFINLLDLRLVATYSYGRSSNQDSSRLFSPVELKCLLMCTPKLRRLWYSDKNDLLDGAASKWLKENRKDLSIHFYSSRH
ncbi:hypothetical protein BGZ73_000505 [Actinomortierella ambigua]|nr:hypothetical protein BGZ73_000505 [Actinomortierella ambigua]